SKYHEAVTNKIYEPIDKERELEYVRKSGADVIGRKGATFYAVSASVCHICKCLLSGFDTPLTASTMLHVEYGIDDVCLSLLNSVCKGKVNGKVILDLNEMEIAELKASAESLKEIIRNTEI
ncbi:MAG: L-lactate dehydrogenase, partial [Clostridia bacterium]|nr:L-lactate dehydrogenase [Clostridia bacterium]